MTSEQTFTALSEREADKGHRRVRVAPSLTITQLPLARNQYINNLPGIFSCIRAGANGATCIRTEMKSLKNLANMRKMIPQKNSPVFARVRIHTPHAFAQKLIPQDFFLHVLVLCRGVIRNNYGSVMVSETFY